MKVVDLINKIANGEKMPEKIIIYDKTNNFKYEMELSGDKKL